MANGITLTSSPTTLSGNYGYIYGPAIAAYTVTSLGTVASSGTGFSSAVYLKGGGSLTNGSNATPTASIIGFGGGAGVDITTTTGTVTNYGLIAGGATGKGIALYAGGNVINGSATDTTALITGHGANISVLISGASGGTVINYGTIGGPDGKAGVSFGITGTGTNVGAGIVINGSTADTTALITGGSAAGGGVTFTNPAVANTVVNFGTIVSTAAVGVYLAGTGTIINSGTAALITDAGEHLAIYAKKFATILNSGTIASSATHKNPIYLLNGGLVINGSETDRTALIVSGSTGKAGVAGIAAHGTIGLTLANFGTIEAGGTSGGNVYSFGGTITNGSVTDTTALIHGLLYNGIGIAGTLPGPITNFGTIIGSNGIFFFNTAAAAGTVINAGTIIGTSPTNAYAVRFAQPGDLLVVQPGASFVGKVSAAGSGNRLELAAGAGVGTLNSLGGNYQGFSTISVDAGADWRLANTSTLGAGVTLAVAGTVGVTGNLSGSGIVMLNGGVVSLGTATSTALSIHLTGTAADTLILTGSSGGTLSNAVVGLGLGDRIELAGIGFDNASSGAAALQFTSGGATVFSLASVSFDGLVNPVFSVGTDLATGNTALTITACFAAGTRIRAVQGEVPVEALREGDEVRVVVGGEPRPIRWLGHRDVDCRRHPKPRLVWPVRISRDAFGTDCPGRDLWLSPDHAVYVADVLIPVKHLINGTTIQQMPVDTVTYYHVELDGHDILFAEGLPCESFLDTGNRWNFDNGGGAIALHPDFASLTWEAKGCAPLVVAGPQLEMARQWIATHAGSHCAHLSGSGAVAV